MAEDECLLTPDEAAGWLDPPIEPSKLRALIEGTGLKAQGVRRRLTPGRPAATYRMADLQLLHAANIPLISQFSSCAPSGAA